MHFLNPKFPSATWDFFCLGFVVGINKLRAHPTIVLGLVQQLVDVLDKLEHHTVPSNSLDEITDFGGEQVDNLPEHIRVKRPDAESAQVAGQSAELQASQKGFDDVPGGIGSVQLVHRTVGVPAAIDDFVARPCLRDVHHRRLEHMVQRVARLQLL